jgi:hypothetical protein
MSKIKTFYGENKTFVRLLIGCLFLLALFVGVATLSGSWPGSDASAQILSALAGAVVAAIITLFLLLGQTSSEEKKERNTKVFEEKLRIYQDFLHKLCDVIKDGRVTKEEARELQFQTAYITMHTDRSRIERISECVTDIIDCTVDQKDVGNDEKKKNEYNKKVLESLFVIVEQFKAELYQDEESKRNALKSRDELSRLYSKAVENFTSINADEEKEEPKKQIEVKLFADNPLFFTPSNANQILEQTTANCSGVEDELLLKQNLEDFAKELLECTAINNEYWRVDPPVIMEAGININIAKKGDEDGTRIIFSHEENGDQYFQIHLESGDTHEIYKHMKWRFGGRQNKWSWWKYLDVSMRNLATLEEIKNRNWDFLMANISKNLKNLVSYVETLEKIQNEIYQPAPKEKANVWLYYEKCVAFDYEKTLNEDRLFMDVELDENGYSITLGNRDNDNQKLNSRLKTILDNVTEGNWRENRYKAYCGLSAMEVVAKIKEIDGKIA